MKEMDAIIRDIDAMHSPIDFLTQDIHHYFMHGLDNFKWLRSSSPKSKTFEEEKSSKATTLGPLG
jgi:hypothetical protein